MIKIILLLIIILGLIIIFLVQPRWILAIAYSTISGVVYFGKTDQPIIALTIDDAPDAETTPLILKILKQHKIKGTFFIISSQVLGNEKILKEIVDDGHELGNHMMEDKPSIKLSSEEFESDLLEAHSILSKFSQVKWMRPASGWYNKRMIEIAEKHNYRVALGSIFPYDTHIHSSRFASQFILFNIQPGSIIVLHDGQARGHRTVLTLAKILPELKKKGYKFATLSELFQGE